MAEKIQIDAGNEQSITALLSIPDYESIDRLKRTLVIMSHGFPGHKSHQGDLYGSIEFLLADRGYHTIRYDYRGCGESDGKEENFTIGSANEDFQTIVYWAKTKGYKRFIYIGEGLGASVSIMNIDIDVAALVLFWPVLDLDLYRKSALKISHIKEDELEKGYVEHNNRRIGVSLLKELKKIDITYAIQDVRIPTLIMHGVQDEDIPISQLDLARSQMNAKRIEITSFQDGKAGLNSPNHRKSVMFQLQQFIEKYI